MTITIPLWIFTVAKVAAVVVVVVGGVPLAIIGVMFLWAFRKGIRR